MTTKEGELSKAEIKKIVDSYQNSIIFNDEAAPISDILSIIESPFLDRADNDALSMVFHKFYKNTEIPISIPVFSFLAYLSAWCVKQKANFIVPLSKHPTELATWVMVLAKSGSSKTFASDRINNLIPVDTETQEPIISPNFTKPNGPAAFVEGLNEMKEGRGFWFQDEASQLFRCMEIEGHPMSEIREYLLLMKDNKKVTRLSKGSRVETKPIAMTQLFINTIDSMVKHISDESMTDGIVRRYQFVMSKDSEERDFTQFPIYDISKILDEKMAKEMFMVFSQDIAGKTFTFDEVCYEMYCSCFKMFWFRQYQKYMINSENIYRTHMMEAWKYAVFHHILHKKNGEVIGGESMQWGLKVVMFLLNSFQMFVRARANTNADTSIKIQQNKIEAFIDYIRSNENKKGFGMRAVCRKFSMKKDDIIAMLKSIRVHDKKFQTMLFEHIGK